MKEKWLSAETTQLHLS